MAFLKPSVWLEWVKKKYLLLLSLLLILVAGITALNIFYWFSSTSGTEDLIRNIQFQEVVGVEGEDVVPVSQNKPKAEEENKPKRPPYIEVDFTQLKKRNPDIAAWLKFDAVDVSIPITQTTDNEYYLTHDVDKQSSKLGWVFADVRSNMEILGFNTVFYGHNNSNKQMFGSLKDILHFDPEKKSTQEILQVTTPYSKMVFQVVSVYVTNYTDWKYVDQVFVDDEEKKEFLKMIRERNTIPTFDSELTVMDRILTFSTCYGAAGTEDRLVVHAKMVAEEWITPSSVVTSPSI